MVRRWVVYALVILAAPVGGCMAAEDRELGPEPGADLGGTAEESGVNRSGYRFIPGPARNVTVWANGTVSAYHECDAPCYINITDITDRIPADVPVRVVATLGWDDGAMSSGILQIRRGSEAISYSGGAYVDDTSYQAVATFLRRTATVDVAMEQSFPHAMATSYSLGIEIAWDPGLVRNVGPVAFEARKDEGIEIAADHENVVSAVVYGPDGSPVAMWSEGSAVTFVPPSSGRFVLLPRQEGGNLTLSFNGSENRVLEPMMFELVQSEMRPYAAAAVAPYSWTFTLDQVPIRVGASMLFPRNLEADDVRPHILIESPEGVVVDWSPECGTTCYVGFLGTGATSQRGHPGLVAGEYTVTYTPGTAEASAAFDFAEFVVDV